MEEKNKNFPDLVVDAVYEGGSSGTSADDPLPRLLGVGNQGQIRYSGSSQGELNFLVLCPSSEGDDSFDPETGTFAFSYTRRKSHGVHILEAVFASLQEPDYQIEKVPPIFLFEEIPTSEGIRSVRFKGLCVPGALQKDAGEDLAPWPDEEEGNGSRKHVACFTVLNAPKISGKWTAALKRGEERLDLAPVAFRNWKQSGVYDPITTPNVRKFRDEDGVLWWELSA